MKTLRITMGIIFLCLSFSSFGQLQDFSPSEKEIKQYKNAIGLEGNSASGYMLTYDRVLKQKGRYSLIGQAGLGAYSTGRDRWQYYGSLKLDNKITWGAHSLEFGIGVLFNKVAYFPETIPKRKSLFVSPEVHVGYEFAPVGQRWYLNAGMSAYASKKFPRLGIHLGGGIKF